MTDTVVLDRSGGGSDGTPEPEPTSETQSRWRPQFGPVFKRLNELLWSITPQGWLSIVVVASCTAFVFSTCHPSLIFSNSTPTGGDMGAHLWGPNYLIHHLLPHGEISGWTPDWYAGFPLYEFYMVVPALMVAALDLGVRNPVLLVPSLIFVVSFTFSGFFVPALHRWRKVLLGVGLFWCVITVPVPYNQAFKLVTISGLLGLPLAFWVFGRLSDLPFPGPPILALASLYMIYNREPNLNGGTGNIIGGNMASTMAGEFAFMLSVVFLVLYLGFLVKGLRTGRYRGTAAVMLALCGLCHLIPVFFALFVTVVALIVWPGVSRIKWAAVTLPIAGLLSSFWVVPFELNHAFVNDMGWEKLPTPGSTPPQTIWNYLIPHALWWPLALAAVGLVVSIVYRYRAGVLLALGLVGAGCAFVWVPQAQLWNARLLPFYYLSMFMLAAVGVSEVARSVGTLLAADPDNPGPWAGWAGAAGCAIFTLVFLGVPLGSLPGETHPATGGVTWLSVFHRSYINDVPGWSEWNYSGLEAKPAATTADPADDLAAGQGGWPELHAMIATMSQLGQEPQHGCGRAFWEYGSRLTSYGTPMAPMLLPYYTNSCIGSMEGLYFESSSTTPFHFLTQCELSEHGSCAERNLDYQAFNHNLGVAQLELLGVKYYLAFSPTAVEAANADPTIKQIAVTGPWHVYQLPASKSALVTSLQNQPVVMKNINNDQGQWLDPTAAWYLNPSDWNVMLAESGPKNWTRITIPNDPITQPKAPAYVVMAETAKATQTGAQPPRLPGDTRTVGSRPLPALPKTKVAQVKVSDIVTTDNRISFNVDKVGSPVLVKTSYFPNWHVSGGKGPWRVSPNEMVVIPTSTHVSLHYGRTDVDYLAWFMTFAGVLSLIYVATRMGPLAMPEPKVRLRRPARVPSGAGDGGDDPMGGQAERTGLDFSQWVQTVAPSHLDDWPHPADPGNAEHGTASPGTASPGTASPGTASPGTDGPGTGENGAGENSVGGHGAGENGAGENGAGENGAGGQGAGENGAGGQGAGENGAGGQGSAGKLPAGAVETGAGIEPPDVDIDRADPPEE